MRIIPFHYLVEKISKLIPSTARILPSDVLDAITCMRAKETSSLAASILDQIIENAGIASREFFPLCQDTGIAVFFVDIGDEVRVENPGLDAAIQEGTREGYSEGNLRMSMVRDPLRRVNTGDNSPAIVHIRMVPGERLSVTFCPKGGGCENMSRLAMLSPADGRKGVVDFVVDTVLTGGGRPCPPVIVGVGLGGDFEVSAILSKRALLRKVGDRNTDAFYASLEQELLGKINSLGIGPMGLGGSSTALDVFIETAPCHIASMPLAVNIQCHSARHGKIEM